MSENQTSPREGAQGLACPVCRVDLVMTDRQGIEIDYCPKCRGVWLDRGELDKIIERSAGPGNAEPHDNRMRQDSHGGGKHGRGHQDSTRRYDHGGGHGYGGSHRSFLSRLFD